MKTVLRIARRELSDVFAIYRIKIVCDAFARYLLLPFLVIGGMAIAQDAGGGAAGALTTASDIFKQVVVLATSVIAAIAFLIVAWATLSKFNDARRGRAEWMEVMVPFAMGAALLVLLAYLIDNANTASEAISTGG